MQYWWEPNTPISIAFWSVSGICLMFIILAILCCCLWRGAKRSIYVPFYSQLDMKHPPSQFGHPCRTGVREKKSNLKRKELQ